MLKQDEYYLIKNHLENYGLFVCHVEGDYEFLNYREKENKYVMYSITKGDKGFHVNTFFGGVYLNTVDEVLELITTDWDEENWIEEEINGEMWITLKKPFIK